MQCQMSIPWYLFTLDYYIITTGSTFDIAFENNVTMSNVKMSNSLATHIGMRFDIPF